MDKEKYQDDDLLEVFDIKDRIAINKDKIISQESNERFLNSIMDNYFLDNDNIIFLQEHGYAIFYFDDNESCICGSNKKYQDCHKKLLKSQGENYITYAEALNNDQDYNEYLNINKILIDNISQAYINTAKCNFLDCDRMVIKTSLVDDKKWLTSIKVNYIDTKLTIGNDFFINKVDKILECNSFCLEHNDVLKKMNNWKSSFFLSSAFTLQRNTIIFNFALSEFENKFNSIKSDGYKALMIYHLRKLKQEFKSSLLQIERIRNAWKTNDFSDFKLHNWKIDKVKNQNFQCSDFFYPQIMPENFETVNSVNNPLTNIYNGFVFNEFIDHEIMSTFVWHKDDDKITKFMNQWIQKIKTDNEVRHFISNVCLILSNVILFDENYYSKLTKDEQILNSALSKFRFETPKMGQEYIKMKFFAGFDSGNDLF
ncbi:SEC-C metal-binding domain-containing protein [Spiroplasma endosymbiont of Labia minor]|uniref:SEC-C metal-binding domain-containing protein n=1 Tax=Spiroplasma endosymbiont of Labia minor TaxID=3066305 RepID=UPI0030CE140E